MPERLTLPDTHAISVILKDHDTVKDLFDRFEKAETPSQRDKIIVATLTELKISCRYQGGDFREEINKMATRSSHSHSARSSSKGNSKVHKVMKEHKQGKLKSGSGKKVKSRKQAVAIALSGARKSGAKIPKKKKSRS